MTDKTASGIDNYALILAILKQESMPKTTIVDMLRWQAEFLGYVDGRDSKRDINDWLVLDSKTTNYGTAWLRLYSLPHGVERQYKCNKKWWATHQCKSGDVIKAVLDDAPKWTKNSNGKFVKTGETEVQVKCFKVLEE